MICSRKIRNTHLFADANCIKVKVAHGIITYWGSGGIAPRMLDLGTLWR
jgi:hypothetical protein